MMELTRPSDFIFIILTIILTAYAQIMMKWQSPKLLEFPATTLERIRFRLNFAYPFYSLIFVVVLTLSAILFHETITLPRFIGIALIVVGGALIGQG